MFHKTWYHGTIRRYVILFGTVFNDIRINRVDSSNNVKDVIKVPLSYAPKEKMLARIDNDPDLDREVAITLPRMGFEITNITYAPDRKLPTIKKHTTAQSSTDDDVIDYYYNPVPYDINMSLYVLVKYVEDGTRIIEQILPYFTPEWSATIKLIDTPEIVKDIPIVLNDVSQEDSYEGNFEERRALIWTLNFTLKGYLFGPKYSSGIIKNAYTNFLIPTSNSTAYIPDAAIGNTNVAEYFHTYPGMTANGEPTTNSSLTVAANSINSDDNYDFIIDFSGPQVEE